MPMRRVLVAFALIALALASSWFIPGLAWRGLAAMQGPGAASAQADSAQAATPPPTAGAVPAPETGSAAPASTSPWSRLSGLLGSLTRSCFPTID